MNSLFKLLSVSAVAVTSMSLVSCSGDEVKEVYQGDELRFTTQISRATSTTTESLNEFKVYAEQLGTGGNFFINGEIAKRKAGNVFEFVNDRHYWPAGVNTLRFWAYAPTDVEADMAADAQSCDFTPLAGLENPGKDQKDLIVAYTEAHLTGVDGDNIVTGGTVHLKFDHALSRVTVSARCEDVKWDVKVKGAWIVNAKKDGKLEFDKENEVNHMNWTSYSDTYEPENLSSYGLELTKPTAITHTANKATFLIGGDSDNSSLMLVPQKAPAFNFTNTADKVTNGAYILLLCRVEVEHDGEFHPDNSTSDDFTAAVKTVGDKHIHLQFPNVTEWSDNAYGYTCIPVAIDWEPGKSYNYVLKFCGKSSGAGMYPPELPDEFPEATPAPAGKNPGNPVLNDYIKFDVEVSNWTDAGLEEFPMQ